MTRTAAHVSLAGIDLDRHSAVPLSIQIYEGLRRAILRGQLRSGELGCAMVFALVACVRWLGWYSDFVLRATAGLNGIVPADEMPATFRWLTLVVTVWCLVGIASCFRRRVEARVLRITA